MRIRSIVNNLDKLYEFDRQPVTEGHLQGGRHFAGVFAGEHMAGTEFVIGVLFVMWGATAFDIFVGLLVGNALAVLSWTFICAPIATDTRLTLYWYLRRIAGPFATTIYNVLSAIISCVMAGCMITVAASTIRVAFGIPAQTKWYPEDWRFVVIVIVLGMVITILAILGFKRLAQFSEVCAPWTGLMFVAGGIAMLPFLESASGQGRAVGFADLWRLAKTAIWTGTASPGHEHLDFWHVAAFAWVCNLKMHIGLSEMAILRFAKKTSYGLYSSLGMFFGHYAAWFCSGIMGVAAAKMLGKGLTEIDSGDVATQALGAAGAVAVLLGGWTTSNPSMYRAGLAFQVITPGWARWKITLAAGAVTTAIACFPFVFTKLGHVVGIYGLVLMPAGAIVVTEHWIFPRIGLTRYWAAHKGLIFSCPAMASWGAAMAAALVLNQIGRVHLFFLFIPVWLITVTLYIIFATMAGAREKFDQPIEEQAEARQIEAKYEVETGAGKFNKKIWAVSGIISLTALAMCAALPIWVYAAEAGEYARRHEILKDVLIWPSVVYFTAASVWLIEHEKRVKGRRVR